jgi:hypothetical protein
VPKFNNISQQNALDADLLSYWAEQTSMAEDKRIELSEIVCAERGAKLHIRTTEKRCPTCGKRLPQPDKKQTVMLNSSRSLS